MKKTPLLCMVLIALCLLSACNGQGTSSATYQKENSILVPVELEGGSGKASVESPAELREENGSYIAVIEWSSPNYDYMIVDGKTYYPVNTEGNSVFEIPVPSAECTVNVQADTTAMSTPHLVDYSLVFGKAGSAGQSGEALQVKTADNPLPDMNNTGKLGLEYAQQYSVDFYDGDIALITISGKDRYLLVPEDKDVPEKVPDGITVLKQPVENIYLVSSSAMDMFGKCNGMDNLRFCAPDRDGWYIDCAIDAIDSGKLTYAGKYSSPDYELLKAGNCGLAIENTMIYHSPQVVENIENLGIPVLIEHSSYESTPQGRMEWIKLYGLLTGHLDEAAEAFEKQIAVFDGIAGEEPSGSTAAIFYITTNGTVSVRNASDYLAQMIELAGGSYVFGDIGTDSRNSTSNIQMEEFYALAKDADYILYNSTVAGELETMDDFLSLSPLFESMKAVKDGNVYCITRNLYQSSMELGDFTLDLYNMFGGNTSVFEFIKKLN